MILDSLFNAVENLFFKKKSTAASVPGEAVEGLTVGERWCTQVVDPWGLNNYKIATILEISDGWVKYHSASGFTNAKLIGEFKYIYKFKVPAK